MNDAVDPPSPWSSDEVPVSTPPTAVVWDNEAPPTEQLGGAEASLPTRSSVQPIVIVGLALVACIVVAALVWPGGAGDDNVDDAPADASAPTTTLDTLPERVVDPETASGATEAGPGEGTSTTASAGPIERIDVPDLVAAVASPTELIVQSTDGMVHTISLPSGNVRSVDLGTAIGGQRFGGGTLVGGPDASMFATFGANPVIIPRSGVPIEVDHAQFGSDSPSDQVSPYGWVTGESGDTVFVVAVYEQATGSRKTILVSTDGTVVESSQPTISNFAIPVAAQGVQIINDSGGAYRLDIDGSARRFTDGTVVAVSPTQVLIRRCDEALNCQFVLRPTDAADGSPDERELTTPESLETRSFGVSLSPDGTAVSFTRYAETTRRVVVGLEDGRTIEAETGDFGGQGAWARDGSGEFAASPAQGIIFLDRESGNTFVFGEALGQIAAIAVRYPDSELVDDSIPSTPIGFSTRPAGDIRIQLLTTGRVGALTLIDLDAATASTWNAPSTPGLGPARIFTDGAEALVLSANAKSGYLATFGSAEAVARDSLPMDPIFVGPGGDGLWARNSSGDSAVDHLAVTIAGRPTDRPEPPRLVVEGATLLGDDGAGSLVFERGGSIYSSTENGSILLTTGELVALGTATALVRECDVRLACAVHLVDLASAERLQIEAGAPPNLGQRFEPGANISLAGSMSPDGGVALLRLTGLEVAEGNEALGEELENWVLVDLATSDVIDVGTPTDFQPVVWNSDSTYAILVSDGRVWLYERSTQSIIEVTGVSDVRGVASVDPEFRAAEPAG